MKVDKVKGLVEVGKGVINASINLYYVGYRLASLVSEKEDKDADRNK
jgi:hypothetical protein